MLDVIEIPVADVIVRDRIRKDLGDTSGLMISMEKVGQLQPIGITSGNVLVFGARRLDAAQRANWETILAVRLDNLTDALKLAQAERDENEERKPFTPSEAVAAGKAIEAIEKPKAQQRKAAGLKQNAEENRSGKLPERSEGDTRDNVAAAVGMSGRTYEKAKAVVAAAEKPDAPPEVKAAAEEMDRTGKVDPAFQAVKAASEPPKPPDDGEALRAEIRQLVEQIEVKIAAFCQTPAGHNHDRLDGLHRLAGISAWINGRKRRAAVKASGERDGQISVIYAAYPRQINPVAAKKAIGKSLDIVPFDELLEAVREYAEATESWSEADRQFIPYAQKWFNQRRWEEDRAGWRRATKRKPSKTAGLEEFAANAARRGREVEPGVELIGGDDAASSW